jgi:hypothetical protein
MKKLNQETVANAVMNLVAVSVGVMVSDGLVAVIPDNEKQIGKLGIAGAGLAGVAMLPTKNTKGKILSGLALGASVKQAYNLVTDALKQGKTKDPEAGVAGKFIQGSIGLACANDGVWQGGQNTQSHLASPVMFPNNDVMVIEQEHQNINRDLSFMA